MNNDRPEEMIAKNSSDLIIYQVGEVKNILTTLATKVDANQEKIDKRVSALENWKSAQEQREKLDPKPLDVQKIILSAFGLVSAAIALSLAMVQTGIVK